MATRFLTRAHPDPVVVAHAPKFHYWWCFRLPFHPIFPRVQLLNAPFHPQLLPSSLTFSLSTDPAQFAVAAVMFAASVCRARNSFMLEKPPSTSEIEFWDGLSEILASPTTRDLLQSNVRGPNNAHVPCPWRCARARWVRGDLCNTSGFRELGTNLVLSAP